MNSEGISSISSNAALDFECLSEPLQSMLAEAVDEYVIAVEEGCEPNRHELLKKYAPIREQLSAYLDQIDWLHDESVSNTVAKGNFTAASTTGLAYDDFEIDVELGRGAMGIVHRAFQKSLQRWVAIKVLPYGTLVDEQRTQRFWREAKIAGALEHPGIVSVYGFGRHKDICFYAMTLVEGRSLDRHIRDVDSGQPKVTESSSQESEKSSFSASLLHGPERYRHIARMVSEAADAIHAAHLAGVIHRDIKPSNLIVDQHGRVKVTDFGLAVDMTDAGLTRSGEVIGTIRYMSPEQATGKRGLVDQRSDIYCLGATLYELLTYRPPFASESLADVIREKEDGVLTQPRSIDPRFHARYKRSH